MRDTGSKIMTALVILIAAVAFALSWGIADAGVYLESAHGDATDGVDRSALGYPIGFCDHCHEQHASIGGSEPVPTGGPSEYLLFYTNHTGQTDNFCYQCHTDSGSYAITNLTYSYRAGRWVDSVDDVLEMFSYASPGSSHNLDNISTFITGKWNYTADSNPCNACHNPHAAQGDPIGAPRTSAKTTTLGNRGWPVSRPSQHSKDNNDWGIWGDGSGEKMSDYGGTYQAPYKYNSTSAYEPDGSTTTDGSNLADYVTLCTDCHNTTYTSIASDALGTLKYFAWANEKHGGTAATDDFWDNAPLGGGLGDEDLEIDDIIDPYDEATTNYVLSCMDCHEPHGSVNRFLIREGVNGGTAVTDVEKLASENPDNTKEWKSLCSKCHDVSSDNNKTIHHWAYKSKFGSSYAGCVYCHEPEAEDMRNCLQCHYHGSTTWPEVSDYGLSDYDYSEKLF